MDYMFWFWILITFVLARWLPRSVYIGNNEEKYKKADWGILLRSKK